MQLINGRTAEQWRTYDRAHLAIAFLLAFLLWLLSMLGHGPGRASACCAVPEAPVAAAAVPTAAPIAPTPLPAVAPTPLPAPTPDPACADALPATVLFATNGADLTAEDRAALDRVVRCLGDRRLDVSGHADSSGTDAVNERLGQARAEATTVYLVAHGVDRSRIDSRGFAASRPVADNATPEGRAQNRRAEVKAQ